MAMQYDPMTGLMIYPNNPQYGAPRNQPQPMNSMANPTMSPQYYAPGGQAPTYQQFQQYLGSIMGGGPMLDVATGNDQLTGQTDAQGNFMTQKGAILSPEMVTLMNTGMKIAYDTFQTDAAKASRGGTSASRAGISAPRSSGGSSGGNSAAISAQAGITQAQIDAQARLEAARIDAETARAVAAMSTGTQRDVALLQEQEATKRFNAEMAFQTFRENLQTGIKLGEMYGSGQLRDTLGAAFFQVGLTTQPPVGSSMGGGLTSGGAGSGGMGWINAPQVPIPGTPQTGSGGGGGGGGAFNPNMPASWASGGVNLGGGGSPIEIPDFQGQVDEANRQANIDKYQRWGLIPGATPDGLPTDEEKPEGAPGAGFANYGTSSSYNLDVPGGNGVLRPSTNARMMLGLPKEASEQIARMQLAAELGSSGTQVLSQYFGLPATARVPEGDLTFGYNAALGQKLADRISNFAAWGPAWGIVQSGRGVPNAPMQYQDIPYGGTLANNSRVFLTPNAAAQQAYRGDINMRPEMKGPYYRLNNGVAQPTVTGESNLGWSMPELTSIAAATSQPALTGAINRANSVQEYNNRLAMSQGRAPDPYVNYGDMATRDPRAFYQKYGPSATGVKEPSIYMNPDWGVPDNYGDIVTDPGLAANPYQRAAETNYEVYDTSGNIVGTTNSQGFVPAAGMAGGGQINYGTQKRAIPVGEGRNGEGFRNGTAEMLVVSPDKVEVIPMDRGAATGASFYGGMGGSSSGGTNTSPWGRVSGATTGYGGLFGGGGGSGGDLGDSWWTHPHTAPAPTPAPAPAPGGTNPSPNGSPYFTPITFPGAANYVRPDINQLPALQSLRNNTRLYPGPYGGPITAPEIGITTPIPQPMYSAAAYNRISPWQQQQYTQLLTSATNIPAEEQDYERNFYTPGYRRFPQRTMQQV